MSALTIWVIAISAAGAALLLGLLALVLARPGRGLPEEEPVWSTTPAEDAEFDRLRVVADLATTIDLPDLCRRVLTVGLRVAEADAGAISVHCQAPVPSIVESSGLTSDDLEWLEHPLQAPNDSSIITRYLYEGLDGIGQRFGTALLVPLRDAKGESLGNLAALWRVDLGAEADTRVRALEVAVADATAALTNAVRFHQVSALSIRDTDTGLLNRRYFAGKLDTEVRRAHKANEPLALLLVSSEWDDAEYGASPAADAQLVELADFVQHELGAGEGACRLTPAVLAVHVPKTLAELEPTLVRVRRRLAEGATGNGRRGGLVVVVQLEHGEDAEAFYHRAEVALRSARHGQQALGATTFAAGG